MKKRQLLVLLMVALLALILCACSNSNNEQPNGNKPNASNPNGEGQGNNINNDTPDAKGRYLEENIEMPEFAQYETTVQTIVNKENRIELYTCVGGEKTTYNCYTLNDDDTWKKTSVDWLNNSVATKKIMADICLGQDGYYYAILHGIMEGSASIIRKNANGVAETLDIKMLNQDNVAPTKIKVFENGKMALYLQRNASDNSIVIVNSKGEKEEELVSLKPSSYQVYGNLLYTINQDKKIVEYNADTQSIESTISFDGDIDTMQFYRSEDKGLIGVNKDGIHCYSQELSLWETMVDGASQSLSLPSYHIRDIAVKSEERDVYYVVFNETGLSMFGGIDSPFKLKKYVYNKDASSVPQKSITVFSLEENTTIRQAIALYQTKHTDVKIDYVVANTDGTGVTSDYIKILNTELFTGNGADVLILDGLSAQTYIEKGVLADLSDIFNSMPNSSNLLSNVLNCYQKDQKIYQMPVRISIPVLAGNTEVVGTKGNLEELASYVNNANSTVMKKISTQALLDGYLSLYVDTLFKNDILDKEALKNFLVSVKTINDNMSKDIGYTVEKDDNQLFTKEMSRRFASMGNPYTMIYENMNSFDGLFMLNGIKAKGNMSYTSLDGRFIPSAVVGMNSKSKDIETTKDFIKFLFSEEMQQQKLGDGFPVLEQSLEMWFNQESIDGLMGTWDEDGNTISGNAPNQQEKQELFTIIKNANTPVQKNETLNQLIANLAIPYLEGEKQIDQVVSEISQKVMIYLSE